MMTIDDVEVKLKILADRQVNARDIVRDHKELNFFTVSVSIELFYANQEFVSNRSLRTNNECVWICSFISFLMCEIKVA